MHQTDDKVPAYKLFARLGKRVLRPGGLGLTRKLLDDLDVRGADVVELAAGPGATARPVRARGARTYTGVDIDEEVSSGTVRADAASTGLPNACADVVFAEAVLTLQSDEVKRRIIGEAVRLLRPGGRFGLHELTLTPDSLTEAEKTGIRQALARVLRVNARPRTAREWEDLLAEFDLSVESVHQAPMRLLEPRRLIADEGLGAVRFAVNVLRHPVARRRLLAIRATLRQQNDHLCAVALVARKSAP